MTRRGRRAARRAAYASATATGAEPAEAPGLYIPESSPLTAVPPAPPLPGVPIHTIGHDDLLTVYNAQVTSRWLDVAAQRLRVSGRGVAHDGSSGREGSSVLALALRSTDPVLPAYPPGALHLIRAALAGRRGAVSDLALALTMGARPTGAAAIAEVSSGLSGGLLRGRRAARAIAAGSLAAPAGVTGPAVLRTGPGPANLPPALGIAWAIGRQRRGRGDGAVRLRWPDDAVAVASFAAADVNHSTTTGTVNAACWAARQKLPLPLLMVCEDDGGSGSIRVPRAWIQAQYENRAGLRYYFADTAADPGTVLEVARTAAEVARVEQVPVMLHLGGVDLRAPDVDRRQDPLAATMTALVTRGVLDGSSVGMLFLEARDRVAAALEEVLDRTGTHPATPGSGIVQTGIRTGPPPGPVHRPDVVAARATRPPDPRRREDAFVDGLPEAGPPLTLAGALGRALLDAGADAPYLLVMGRDVARRGGRFGVTSDLQRRLGPARVFDSLPDDQGLLGLALGAAASGLLPVVELPHVGALQAVAAQLRLDPAMPLVLRVPWFAGIPAEDQAAADLGIGALRDLPGMLIACPAHPSDAPGLLRTCVAAAEVGSTVVLLEPVALYHERDLAGLGDGGWLAPYATPAAWQAQHAPIGRAVVRGSGADLTIATFGTCLRKSLRAAQTLAREGIGSRVVDLRWLAPLPVDDVVREAELTGRLLIVDESRRTGGISESVVTSVLESGFAGRLARITPAEAAEHPELTAARLLPTEAEIVDTARALLR